MDDTTWLKSLSKTSSVPDRATSPARRPSFSVSSAMASDIESSISARRSSAQSSRAQGGSFTPTQGSAGRTGTDYRA